jgi:hypothetical protein
MEHLYSSLVKAQKLQTTVNNGMAETVWVDLAAPLNSFKCRLDLNFLRPGKDAPPAYEAGVAPDRVGILFCSASLGLKAGYRIVTLSGPVSGTFDIRMVPDVAVDYDSAHHIEVQIVETPQSLTKFGGLS